MNSVTRLGTIIFGIGMTGLSILCVLSKDFIVGRPPSWSVSLDFNPLLGQVSGVLLLLLSLAIILRVKGGVAAFLIALLILLLSVSRHFTQFMSDWANAYKTLALVGGSLIMACSFFKREGDISSSIRISPYVVRIITFVGCLLIASFFIASGYAHFKFAAFVEELIPSYIPFRAFWTYFTGVCLIGGGLGILLPLTRRLAALLSGVMVLGWFLLLHIPRIVANMNDAGERLGLFESFTFVGIFFALSGNTESE